MPSSEQAGVATLLLADARLPVGGHAQSGGLEPAIVHGLEIGDVPAFITARLRTVARIDAGAAVVARHAVVTQHAATDELDPDKGATRLSADDVETAWAARTPSGAARNAALATGRGIHRLLTRLAPDSDALTWLEELPRERRHRPVALGALAAHLGLDAHATARVAAYDDIQTVASAATKILPLDPLDPVMWTLAAAPELEALVDEIAPLRAPRDIPATAAPHLDLWLERHAHTTRRLFHA